MYINTDEYIDASEAAKILGIKRARMSQLCNEGRFNSQVKIGHFWLIPRVEVEKFTRQKPGKKKIEPIVQESTTQESKPYKVHPFFKLTSDAERQEYANKYNFASVAEAERHATIQQAINNNERLP